MKVYYTNDEAVLQDSVNVKQDMSMAYLPPELLGKHIPEKMKLSDYVQCPAFTGTIRNTYALRFPFDFTLKINTQTWNIESNRPEFVKTYLTPPYDNSGVLQLHLGTLFFADKSCVAEQVHPYLHSNSLTQNANVLQGQFDIGKWFRPINLAFRINSTDKEVVIDFNRGDVYSYLRLHTNEKVNMYEFENTLDINTIMARCVSFKNAKTQPLKQMYDSFLRKKYNKKLLKLIQQNKIGEI